MDGEIQCHGTLTIGERAEVRAKISGDVIVIRGKVEGNVVAKEKVELVAPARLFGDIDTPRLVITEGVVFDGDCTMGVARQKGGIAGSQNLNTDKAAAAKTVMRANGLGARPKRRSRPSHHPTGRGCGPRPQPAEAGLSAAAPNQKWVSDFTYIETAEGWLYLAVVLDLFSRRVIGWAMSETMDTALVLSRPAHGPAGPPAAGRAAAPLRSGQPVHQRRLPAPV